MFLAEKASGHLVEVLDLRALFNPCEPDVIGRSHYGEEAQNPETFVKRELLFPSGEPLPRCWLDPEYRQAQIARVQNP